MTTRQNPAVDDPVNQKSGRSPNRYEPDERLPGISAATRRRLLGRRIPVFSYLRGQIDKHRRRAISARQLRRTPDRVRLHGVVIEIDPARFSDKIVRHLYEGAYEKDESLALLRTLEADDRVLELGSGIGYMSALAARRVGSDRVMTVEANTKLAPVIETTYRLNDVAPTSVFGLMSTAADPSPRTFYTHTEHLWSSSLHRPDANYEPTEVAGLSWQDTLAAFQPSYLLMDIEGGEIELLADFDYPAVCRMLIEFHPRKTGHEAIDGVFAHLAQVGFGVARVPRGGNVFYFERRARPAD